jgi:hypothetical protein
VFRTGKLLIGSERISACLFPVGNYAPHIESIHIVLGKNVKRKSRQRENLGNYFEKIGCCLAGVLARRVFAANKFAS